MVYTGKWQCHTQLPGKDYLQTINHSSELSTLRWLCFSPLPQNALFSLTSLLSSFFLAASARLTVLCASKCNSHHLSSLWLTFPSPLQLWSIPGSHGRISFRCTSDQCGDVSLSWVVLPSYSCLHPWPGRSKDQRRTPPCTKHTPVLFVALSHDNWR